MKEDTDINIIPIQPPSQSQSIDDVIPMAVQPPSSNVEDDTVVDIEASKGGRNETQVVSTTDQPSTAQLQSNNNTTCTASKVYICIIGILLVITGVILGVVLGTGSSNDDNVNNSNVGSIDTDVQSSAEDMVSSDTNMQMEGDKEVETVLQNDDDNNDCSLTDLTGGITTFGQNLGSTINKNGGGVCYRVTFGTYGTFNHGYDTVDPSCTDYKPRLTIGTYYRSEGGGIISYYTGGSDLYACDSYGGRSGIVKLIFDESISQVVVTAGEVSSCRYEMIITTPNCAALRSHLKLTNSIESTFELTKEVAVDPSIFSVSSNRVSDQADHDSICKTEFGSEWKIADWEYDIKAMEEENIIQLMNLLGISPINSDLEIADTRWYDGYFVTTNGNKYYGPRGVRVYNFHYISGGAPSWFAVHDSHANDLFLGSWYDMERYVLCKKTATVNEEVGSSESTTLAIERAGEGLRR